MRIVFVLLIASLVVSCSPLSKSLQKSINQAEEKFQDHVGFVLYDPATNKTIINHNGAKYFTPASNTKILTFYTSLRLLGDSVPALNYVERNDSLIFWGTGDPSFLYKNVYNNHRVYDFLSSSSRQLYFSPTNFYTSHFGTGWAWDDYNSNYSAERSPLPVYGDIFTVKLWSPVPEIIPSYFQQYYSVGELREKREIIRELNTNDFKIHPGNKSGRSEWEIPFHVTASLIADLLSDTLNKPVTLIDHKLPLATRKYYSIPTDSLYKVMMQDSDNFIAEQLLLLCSDVLRDSLQPEIAIRYSKEHFLYDLPDEPIWVDGSGLSRYNLFTPRSIVKLWQKIYATVPRERLFPLLATGGKYGTIKNWYKADAPFIFGKTGTLNNNHALSGYLVTKSGKTLIFSFMNNNYVTSTNEIRKNMQEIFKMIYEEY